VEMYLRLAFARLLQDKAVWMDVSNGKDERTNTPGKDTINCVLILDFVLVDPHESHHGPDPKKGYHKALCSKRKK
jgi:hypothetical protein